MRNIIEKSLSSVINTVLVKELLESYDEIKRSYYLGGWRLSEVEGGRFSEAVFRVLQEIAFGKFDPIGKQIDTEKIISSLSNVPNGHKPDSIRIHIPRSLRVIYDIRNKRDAAHLADGIDPNLQDATLVVSVADWVMAELVRLYHNVSPGEAYDIVNSLVTRQSPVIQDFDGFLKILHPSLKISDQCLVILFQRGDKGATIAELKSWLNISSTSNLKRTLNTLCFDKKYLHFSGNIYKITYSGQREVQVRQLLDF